MSKELQKFVDAFMLHVSRVTGVPVDELLRSFTVNAHVDFMRRYEQAGPWADMLTEGGMNNA